MAGKIYGKPIMFAVVALAVILVGTAAVMLFPMYMTQMHPKLETLKQYTPLELAGRDVYQREGCNNCHTQTVRPLKTEVMRYGEYSKAGEFAYDQPFLWGSKRTGPDLARVGLKYPPQWHYMHFDDPQSMAPKSDMPKYGWLKNNALDPQSVKAHMDALSFKYNAKDIEALKGKNELDALVAYMMTLGRAVAKPENGGAAPQQRTVVIPQGASAARNPLAVDPSAVKKGEGLFTANCVSCHGEGGTGKIGPNLTDNVWLGKSGDIGDGEIFQIISHGTQQGMPAWGNKLSKFDIWALVTYIRSLHQKS